MNIDWQVIPHSDQRYDTAGDWFWADGGETLLIRVSRMREKRFEFLCGLHELIEAVLCSAAGITEGSVTAFDVANLQLDDPGNDPRAPYHWQHRMADSIERLVAALLRIDWKAYESEIQSL